jgi:Glutathione-dependent formaldehyde-activating enzyme
MKLEGGCYCGQMRYVVEGEPIMKAQCHCRECQYISGGSPNMFLLMPPDGFSYTKGTPKQFTRSDLEGRASSGCRNNNKRRLGRMPLQRRDSPCSSPCLKLGMSFSIDLATSLFETHEGNSLQFQSVEILRISPSQQYS